MTNIDISKLPTINVGIVGHIDHGKTTLLSKLSGKWTDTHSQESKRGITIKLGYSDSLIRIDKSGKYTSKKDMEGDPVRYLTFVDAPGHEMLMATTLSGAAIMDATILVVAANEGIKPQTKEHLMVLEAKKIKNIIIAQNKIDLVSKEEAMKSYKEIKEFVRGTIAENSPIIPISAQQEVNLDKILEVLCNIEIPLRDVKSNPLFLVARSFDINKPGTDISKLNGGVLGGALKRGTLKVGDEIEIKPGYSYKKQNQFYYQTVKTKIISLHRGDYSLSEATPGGSLAIETDLDPSLTKGDSLSGCVASTVGTLEEIEDVLTVKYNLFNELEGSERRGKIENLRPSEMLMLSINTSTTVGTIKKIKDNIVELALRIPVVPIKGESLGIARNVNSHWRLIGFGEIV